MPREYDGFESLRETYVKTKRSEDLFDRSSEEIKPLKFDDSDDLWDDHLGFHDEYDERLY